MENAETAAMVLIEGEFPLTWFFTTALLSKRETKVSSVYTWTDDTAEGVYRHVSKRSTDVFPVIRNSSTTDFDPDAISVN